MEESRDIVALTEEYVRNEMNELDGSHDFHHIQRVRAMALKIAQIEQGVDLEIVQLAALLHDIDDWKYRKEGAKSQFKVREWLTSQNYDHVKLEKVFEIVEGIGFKSEIGTDSVKMSEMMERLPELAVVQDADRLDAIGAIGIARAFTFGGTRKSPLHNPDVELTTSKMTQDQYMKKSKFGGSTIQHFHDKLFHLKDMMKTDTGKMFAQERHDFMVQYVARFMLEWDANV